MSISEGIKNSVDEEYWAQYYRSGQAPEEPSSFAKYIEENYTTEGQKLIELGCGNGRDARFFAAMGMTVLAIDKCSTEIGTLDSSNNQTNLVYAADDFTNLPESEHGYDLIYSRFTLHSVDAEGQDRVLDWSARNLLPGGILGIETRGQKNELFQKGEPVIGEEDAYIYEDHYRRFTDFDKLKTDVSDTGLTILEASEETGFAPYGDTDYHFIRMIARKAFS